LRRCVARPGKSSSGFPSASSTYLRDLPDAELHMLDTGHFAVEDLLEEIADHIKRFHADKVAGASELVGSAR
jgi:hypothetical protein